MKGENVPILAPCCERTAEVEGILMGCQEYAERHNIEELPVCMGFTGMYPENAQLRKVSTTCKQSNGASGLTGGDVAQGFDIMMGHFRTYAELDGYFRNVVVLPFLDHGQPDGELNDKSILENPKRLSKMAIAMYDCSEYDLDENIDRVRKYVERYGDGVVIEAAVDKIYSPAQAKKYKIKREDTLSKPEAVRDYIRKTGADLIVPNLGTEHRSLSEGEKDERKYEVDIARRITELCGKVQVLHGTSCLGDRLSAVGDDGIVKVNLYTAMAVGGGIAVYRELKGHERKVLSEHNLQINSDTFFGDVRRRSVAETIYQYLDMLRYADLGR
jgi:fructose-bisphosphate aldolase class II